MPRDNMGLTTEYNDDRPFVLIPYDHTVQTGPMPVREAVVEAVEAPVAADEVVSDAPAPQSEDSPEARDAAFDFRVDPEAADAVKIEDDIPVPVKEKAAEPVEAPVEAEPAVEATEKPV